MSRYYTDYLCHHGIKGQKWGIRRWVNEDGTLTEAGKQRYGTYENFYKSYTQNKKGLKSDKQVILESKYKSQGMDERTAEIKAIGKRETDKALGIAAGVTVAAAVAAVAGKAYYNYAKDWDFDSIKRVKMAAPGDKEKVEEDLKNLKFDTATFARGTKGSKDLDHDTYSGMHMRSLPKLDRFGYTGHEETYTKTDGSKIKVASWKHGKDVYSSLMKNDPEFRSQVETLMRKDYQLGKTTATDVLKEFDWGKAFLKDKSKTPGYREFNVALVSDTLKESPAAKKFFDTLNEKGYSGTRDLYDTHYGFYAARTASIIVDKSIKSTGHLQLDSKEVQEATDRGMKRATELGVIRTLGKNLGTEVGAMTLASIGIAGLESIPSHTKTGRATKMRAAGASYKEIAKALGIPEDQVGGYIKNSK